MVLFFHLLGALLFVSGIVVAGLAFEAARRRSASSEVAALLGLSRVGVVLVGIGGIMLPAFGLWLVHLGHFGYGSGWVVWALVLYAVAMALGAIGGRRPREARLLAVELARSGAPVGPELRALLDDPASRAANYAAGVVVLAILALMVFKP